MWGRSRVISFPFRTAELPMPMQEQQTPDIKQHSVDTPLEAGTEIQESVKTAVPEINGPKGPEPTRYGDWERKGRCVDF